MQNKSAVTDTGVHRSSEKTIKLTIAVLLMIPQCLKPHQRCCLSLVDDILRRHGEAECGVHLLVEHRITTGGAGLYGPPASCEMGQYDDTLVL